MLPVLLSALAPGAVAPLLRAAQAGLAAAALKPLCRAQARLRENPSLARSLRGWLGTGLPKERASGCRRSWCSGASVPQCCAVLSSLHAPCPGWSCVTQGRSQLRPWARLSQGLCSVATDSHAAVSPPCSQRRWHRQHALMCCILSGVAAAILPSKTKYKIYSSKFFSLQGG